MCIDILADALKASLELGDGLIPRLFQLCHFFPPLLKRALHVERQREEREESTGGAAQDLSQAYIQSSVDYDNKINGRSLGRAGKTKERGRGREEGGAEEDQKEKNQDTVVMPSAIALPNTQPDRREVLF